MLRGSRSGALESAPKGGDDPEVECATARALAAQGHHFTTCFGVGEFTAEDVTTASIAGVKEGDKYLLLERAQGEPLDIAMTKARSTSGGLQHAVGALRELATMVDDMQDGFVGGDRYDPDGKTVVHNDLHPENLFVRQEGGETKLFAIDYGITHTVQNDDVQVTASARKDLCKWYATEFLCVLAGENIQRNAQQEYQFTVGSITGSSYPDALKPLFSNNSARQVSNKVFMSGNLEQLANGDGPKFFTEKLAPGWVEGALAYVNGSV